MSTEQTAIDQADFDEMSMIAEQHTKKEDDVTCSDVRELEEARARIVELELERDGIFEAGFINGWMDRHTNNDIDDSDTVEDAYGEFISCTQGDA